MKLRLSGQSMRVRLGVEQVERLVAGQAIESLTRLGPWPGAQLAVRLMSAPGQGITWEQGWLVIALDERQLRGWPQDEREGFSLRGDAAPGHEPLQVRVEKDYACTSSKATCQAPSDAFAWPDPTSHDATTKE